MKKNIPLIATPISHQFENKKFGKEISEISDCLEVRERSLDSTLENQHLFHIDIDLTHKWDSSLRKYLKSAFLIKPDLKLITLQATRCCHDEKLIDGIFQLSGKVYSKDEMITNSIENTMWLRQNISSKTLIGLENNNYYPTEAYDIITDGDFIKDVLINNNLFLLLDIAHAMVTAHNKKISYKNYISTLPLDKLIQLHICQPYLPKIGDAHDAHNEPNEQMFAEVIRLINEHKTIKYLTIEFYRDKDLLVKSINRLRHLLIKNFS